MFAGAVNMEDIGTEGMVMEGSAMEDMAMVSQLQIFQDVIIAYN